MSDKNITSVVTMPEIKSEEPIMQEIFTLRTGYIRDYFNNPKYLYIGENQYYALKHAIQCWEMLPSKISGPEIYDGMEIVRVYHRDFLKVGK